LAIGWHLICTLKTERKRAVLDSVWFHTTNTAIIVNILATDPPRGGFLRCCLELIPHRRPAIKIATPSSAYGHPSLGLDPRALSSLSWERNHACFDSNLRTSIVTTADLGIYFFSSTGKYMDDLTIGVTTPFTGGAAVETNN